ncbi:MAG: plasmid pRiA4b ORF-3 family protein [Gammaproteobacteria bacterium]|nr:plasmid pRiA4b ORF-3 family protein [Gammaproteobacteria bacterium]
MPAKKRQIKNLTARHKSVLTNTAIDRSEPGSILHDFQMFMDYITENNVSLSRKIQAMSSSTLLELNARLYRPLRANFKRPIHKSYPHINGLYLLLRTVGMGYAKSNRLVLYEPVYAAWQNLNAVERYFTLLEAWLMWGQPEIAGTRLYRSFFMDATEFLNILDEESVVFSNPYSQEETRMLMESPGALNIALLELFGLITVQDTTPAANNKGWQIESLHVTPLGSAFRALTAKKSGEVIELLFEQLGQRADGCNTKLPPFGQWQSLFQPFFPEWRNNLAVSETPPVHEGRYIFKVSLARAWRRIALSGKSSLDTLSDNILNAFDFSADDHLYCFNYRNHFGALEQAKHPYMDEPPFASEVRIEEVRLDIGDSMTYIFDFGDHWEFTIKLEKIETSVNGKPEVLASHGKAPKQYG